jgi:hypothetical protein
MKFSELKRLHEQHNPNSYFFSVTTMRFFGDTPRNFEVYDGGKYWVLARKRKTGNGFPPKTWCFSKENYAQVLSPE